MTLPIEKGWHEVLTKEQLQELKDLIPQREFIATLGYEEDCLTENVWDGVLDDVNVEKGLLQVSYCTGCSGDGEHKQDWFHHKHLILLLDLQNSPQKEKP